MSTKKIKNVTDNISGKYYENVFTRKETFILGLLLIHKMLHLIVTANSNVTFTCQGFYK